MGLGPPPIRFIHERTNAHRYPGKPCLGPPPWTIMEHLSELYGLAREARKIFFPGHYLRGGVLRPIQSAIDEQERYLKYCGIVWW